MTFTARVPVMAGLMALLLISSTGCNRLRANDQINRGVAEFKNGKFEAATNHFQKAVDIDPDNPNPRIYLATTYASQIVPNLDTPDNRKLAQSALDNFQIVLQRDPNNVIALKQIATIDRNIGKLQEAKDYEKKVIALDPNDGEAYSSIGGNDFYQAMKNTTTVLGAEGKTDKGDGNPTLSKPGCAKLTTLNHDLVTEAITSLQKAVAIDPNDENSYTFLSLSMRRKADLECGNQDAIKGDLEQADVYAKKSLGARKEIERIKEAKNKGGVTQ